MSSTPSDGDGEGSGGRRRRLRLPAEVPFVRLLATGSVALALGATGSVLHGVSNVAGRPTLLLAVLAAAVAGATVLARLVSPPPALGVSALLLAAGAYAYFASLSAGTTAVEAVGPVLQDSVALLTGLSILRILNAGTWALAAAPGPTFTAWYLAVRRRYVPAATVAGAFLLVFVLTGDASAEVALLGAIGVAGALGFGDLDRLRGVERGTDVDAGDATDGSDGSDGSDASGGSVDDARRSVLVQLGAVVAVTSSVSVVPGGAASPLRGDGTGGGGGGTLEANLLSTGDQLSIIGSIDLSPRVRFSVTAEDARYWRIGSYDRYTGDGWIRTGNAEGYAGSLPPPPGRSRALEQDYEMEAEIDAMPAARKPVEVSDAPVPVRVVDGSIEPASPLEPGDSYEVTSRVPVATARELRSAGTDYPEGMVERYTPIPRDTPERVATRTSRITANAENPYDTARVIEQWLSNNRGYTLDVSRPGGDIADAFLFEMQAGYCTYFATTMVTMLRTRNIPARFVVGYTPGERVARNRWVARGLNAHAWVEAFFPGHGWIRFDPTPAAPRETVEGNRIESARENDLEGVDTGETGPEPWTPTPTSTPIGATPSNDTDPTPGVPGGLRTPTATPGDVNVTFGGQAGGDDGGFGLPDLPSRERGALGLVVLAGAVAGLRRTGATERAYRAVWVRYQPRTEPVADVRRAYRRAEHVLGRTARPRRPDETVREYVTTVGDDRARRLGRLYERATYAGRADEATADEAVAIADGIVGDNTRLRLPFGGAR